MLIYFKADLVVFIYISETITNLFLEFWALINN